MRLRAARLPRKQNEPRSQSADKSGAVAVRFDTAIVCQAFGIAEYQAHRERALNQENRERALNQERIQNVWRTDCP